MLPRITLGSKRPKIGSKQRVLKKRTIKDKDVIITLDPKNPKNKYYSKIQSINGKPVKITHITSTAKQILKENPKLISFLEEQLFSSKQDVRAKLETKNGSFRLRELFNYQSASLIYELKYKNKNTGEVKRFFIKKKSKYYLENTTPDSEFLAVKEIERLGFNVIKPQFSFTDLSNRKTNIIVYDFTNLDSYYDAIIKKKIKGSEILLAEKIFKKLEKSNILKDVNDFTRYHDGVIPHNVFVKRLSDGRLKFYFSDQFLRIEAYNKLRK